MNEEFNNMTALLNKTQGQLNLLLKGFQDIPPQLKLEKARPEGLEKEVNNLKSSLVELKKTSKLNSDLALKLKTDMKKEQDDFESKLLKDIQDSFEELRKANGGGAEKTTNDYLGLLTSLVDKSLQLKWFNDQNDKQNNPGGPPAPPPNTLNNIPHILSTRMECGGTSINPPKTGPKTPELPKNNLHSKKQNYDNTHTPSKSPYKITIPRRNKVLKVTHRELLDAKGNLQDLEDEIGLCEPTEKEAAFTGIMIPWKQQKLYPTEEDLLEAGGNCNKLLEIINEREGSNKASLKRKFEEISKDPKMELAEKLLQVLFSNDAGFDPKRKQVKLGSPKQLLKGKTPQYNKNQ